MSAQKGTVLDKVVLCAGRSKSDPADFCDLLEASECREPCPWDFCAIAPAPAVCTACQRGEEVPAQRLPPMRPCTRCGEPTRFVVATG